MNENKGGLGWFSSKIVELHTDVLFIRAQSTIRADGFSSAQRPNSAENGGRYLSGHG